MNNRGRKSKVSQQQLTLLGKVIDKKNKKGELVNILFIKNYFYEKIHWRPSNSWVSGTLKKMGYSRRRVSPKNSKQLTREFKKIKKFRKRIKIIYKKKRNIQNFNMWTMDETGVLDCQTPLYTYTKKSDPKPWVKKQKKHKIEEILSLLR